MSNSDPSQTRQAIIKSKLPSAKIVVPSALPSEHMQPMSPQLDDDLIENHPGTIYFYSDRLSDLGRAVLEDPSDVMMTYMTKD